MSLPPELIQVKRRKRKINDHDDVVDFLRVDGDSKRQLSANFVYQRRQPQWEAGQSGTTVGVVGAKRNGPPQILATQPGDENGYLRTPPRAKTATTNTTSVPSKDLRTTQQSVDQAATIPRPSTPSSTDIKIRKFHYSRAASQTSSYPTLSGRIGKHKSHAQPAVFVDRSLHASKRKRDANSKTVSNPESNEPNPPPAATEAPRKQKLPGADRRIPRPASNANGDSALKARQSTAATTTSPEQLSAYAAEMDALTISMNEFALQHIADNLAMDQARKQQEADFQARRTASHASTSAISGVLKPQASPYKPKAPAQRWAERNGSTPSKSAPPRASVDVDMASDVDSTDDLDVDSTDDLEADDTEDDIVIETYFRVPASSLHSNIAPSNVGLLVLDNEPDAEQFYSWENRKDSDEDTEDEEDENAEDYYTADYPDDEVESDDEHDRDPYRYRHGAAWEFDEYYRREEEDS